MEEATFGIVLKSFNYYRKLLLKFAFVIVIFDRFIERYLNLKKSPNSVV